MYEHDAKSNVPVIADQFNRSASMSEYTINLVTNRFFAAYLQGYIDGKENNDNTPAVLAGTCTKIN
jgi:hypothetical protein